MPHKMCKVSARSAQPFGGHSRKELMGVHHPPPPVRARVKFWIGVKVDIRPSRKKTLYKGMDFRWRHGQQWRPPCFFICAIIKVRRKPISPKQWKRRDALPLPRCFFFTEMAAKPKAVRADILPLATMRHHLLKLWKKWPSQARLWTYDAIRGTTSGRFSTEIVFSATNLSVDWN